MTVKTIYEDDEAKLAEGDGAILISLRAWGHSSSIKTEIWMRMVQAWLDSRRGEGELIVTCVQTTLSSEKAVAACRAQQRRAQEVVEIGRRCRKLQMRRRRARKKQQIDKERRQR